MASHITQGCMELVKSFEGFTPVAVWDYHQYSFGYGTRASHLGQRISPAQAERALIYELQKVDNEISPMIQANLSDAQWAALISAGFNLGTGGLARSGIINMVNQGNFNEAAEKLQELCRAGGKRRAGLVERRNKESGLLSGIGNFFGNMASRVTQWGENMMGGVAANPAALSNWVAANFSGTRYVYGGKNAETQGGLDCSGFVENVFNTLFHAGISGAAKDMASQIAHKFKLPEWNYRARPEIPAYAVLSLQYASGDGHVVMVMPDESGPVVWESEGGSRNNASHPGRGVTKVPLQTFLSRLSSSTSVKVTDTTKLFSGMNAGMLLTPEMMLDAWGASDVEKTSELQKTLLSAGLNPNAAMLNFTTMLGLNGEALINRSTFLYNPENGQPPVLNIAQGMNENWTKFSVLSHMAKLQRGADYGKVMEKYMIANPDFLKWAGKLPDTYGLKGTIERIKSHHQADMIAQSAPSFAQNRGDLAPGGVGGRITPNVSTEQELKVLKQQTELQQQQIAALENKLAQQQVPGGVAANNHSAFKS